MLPIQLIEGLGRTKTRPISPPTAQPCHKRQGVFIPAGSASSRWRANQPMMTRRPISPGAGSTKYTDD